MKLHVTALSGFLSACVTSDAPGVDQVEQVEDIEEVEQAVVSGCDVWGCGMNSPNINSFGFHELHSGGLPNRAGFRLTKFEKNGIQLTLNVSRGRLTGHSSTHGVLSGQSLVGARLWIAHGSSKVYVVQIASTSEAPLWARTTSERVWVPTYLFKWTEVHDGHARNRWANLCKLPVKEYGMQVYQSVVFEGDRIHEDRKLVEGIDTSWFNIGCAGSTLAKMFLTGHTHASQAYGFTTTLPERTTMLKALSADFCGHGVPFTVGGAPLEWIDDKYWMKYVAPVELEARWSETGATCLMKPRITDVTKLAVGPYTNIDAALDAHCGGQRPPSCEPDSADELAGAHIVTALP